MYHQGICSVTGFHRTFALPDGWCDVKKDTFSWVILTQLNSSIHLLWQQDFVKKKTKHPTSPQLRLAAYDRHHAARSESFVLSDFVWLLSCSQILLTLSLGHCEPALQSHCIPCSLHRNLALKKSFFTRAFPEVRTTGSNFKYFPL